MPFKSTVINMRNLTLKLVTSLDAVIIMILSNFCIVLAFGYCPYNEVMAFMSLATSGAYLPRVTEILIEPTEPYLYEMNQYHEAFLAWSFRKCLDGIELKAPLVETDKNLWRKGRYTEIK